MTVYAVCVWTPQGFGVAAVAHDRSIAEQARDEQVNEGHLPASAFVARATEDGE